jgi:hypothetical protein
VIRRCDGTDDNLTREVPAAEFDAAVMTPSDNWDRIARRRGNRAIRCYCGLAFEDENRRVNWPHEWI